MTFTIDNSLKIQGTRGDTGTIHITFDRDMTGTHGVFLVKRNDATPDEAAFLVKRFVFGSNPAITGSEVIISFVRADTENIPILLPDSPFVFESDYTRIECSDYVWYIRLDTDNYTQTVIPRPGCKPPVFRLYNEAYFDRGGCPIVPHPPFPSTDIFATKRDLINYAAQEKQVIDKLGWRIDINDRKIEELSGFISSYTPSMTGYDKKIDAATAMAASSIVVANEARILANELDVAVGSFTNTFTSGTSAVYGVDARQCFVKDFWQEEQQFPVLGAALGSEADDETEDVLTVEEAIENLYGGETTLSGNAKSADDALKAAIDEISSGVGPGVTALSGNVVKEFGTVRSEIGTLCGAIIGYAGGEVARIEGEISSLSSNTTSAIATLSSEIASFISTLSGNVNGAITSLSGNAKSAIDTLSGTAASTDAALQNSITSLSSNTKSYVDTTASAIRSEIQTVSGTTYENAVTDALTTINWFLQNTYTPFIQNSDKQCLAYAMNAAASGDATIRGALCAEIDRAKEAEDEKIDKNSIVTNFGGTLTNDQVPGAEAIYGYASSSIQSLGSSVTSLSGNAQTADAALSSGITTLSGNAKTADVAIAGNVSSLSGYATNHESRIKTVEERKFFASQSVANEWIKGFVPNIELNDDGTMKDTSEYTDKDVMNLLLAVVRKMVSYS